MCSSTRPLEEGDIVNIDVTVFIGGHHGDCSETFLVGIHSTINLYLIKYHSSNIHVMVFISGQHLETDNAKCILMDIQIYYLLSSYSWWGRWTLRVRPWLADCPAMSFVLVC